MTRRGVFIVLEGVEGSGKTTQARLLADWLARTGLPHIHVREPGGVEAAEQIRRVLLDSADLPPRTELLLMAAARSALVAERIRPALEAGDVVLADRFELSTFAYQIHGRGLPGDEVRRINAFATAGLRPDLTILLDVPLATGAERRLAAGLGDDRIERAGKEFHDRVAEAYALLSQSEEGVEAIDGTRPAEHVHSAILATLRARFPETFRVGQGL